MNILGYYKTSDGKVVELEQQDKLYLYLRNIIELILPDGCVKVSCHNNQLKDLIIPDGCEIVSCYKNQLKELIIPAGCEYVRCENNQL